MKTRGKVLLATLSAAMLVTASVMGTLAYLQDTDSVQNTFTVGKVGLTLDEADVKLDGTLDTSERVKANEYKLMPGHTYIKDPTVTVEADSEKSYVRMLVTINNKADLDAIFDPGKVLSEFFEGYDEEIWNYVGYTTAEDARTYEFRYHTTVETVDDEEGLKLEPLFTHVVVPGSITNDQLLKLEDLQIDVVAHAIQADGFDDAADAWDDFVVPTT